MKNIAKNLIKNNTIIGILLAFIGGIISTYFLLELKDKCLLGVGRNDVMTGVITKLTRQAARWSTAAKQDENPLVAVLHANYGAGYLWALQDIASPEQIAAATGIDFDKFSREITETQDAITLKAVSICPNFGPESTYLSRIGGENM